MALNATENYELNCAGNETILSFLTQTDAEYLSFRHVYITMLLTLAMLGIILNSAIVYYMLREGAPQSSPLLSLVLELSVANFLVSVFCLLADGIWNATIQWYGGNVLCRTVKYLQMFSLYATTLLLTGMSVEACITTTYPVSKSHRSITYPRVRLISRIAWVLSAICSIPQAIIFHVDKAPTGCVEFYQCVTHGFYSNPTQELAYTMATLCLMWIVPLLLIILCYVITFVQISSEAKLLSGISLFSTVSCRRTSLTEIGRQTQGERLYRQTRRASLWMTFLTATAFVVCWVPYSATMMGHLLDWHISHEIISAIFCLGMSYSVFTPLMFGAFMVARGGKTNKLTI